MTGNKRSDIVVACFLFAVGFAIFWAFRGLGWFAQDEGVLYYHYLRTHRGQLPYRDFFTGYGPVTLYLHAGLFSLFGVSLDATRVYMAGLHAFSGVLLYLVTKRVAPRPYAVMPALLFFSVQPGDIADMAFHNTPYPLWYLVTFFALATWTTMRARETDDPRAAAAWLCLTGLIGGVTLFTKQNGGIFLLWGATGFLASFPLAEGGGSEGKGWKLLRGGYLGLIPLSMLFLIWTFVSPLTLGAFILPIAGLAWIGASEDFSRDAIRRALAGAGWMTLGVLVATLPWLAYFAGSIGVWGFIEALFFWGKYVDRQLFLAFPMPGRLAAFLLGGVAAAWYCTHVLYRYRTRPRPRWVVLSAATVGGSFVSVLAGFLLYNRAEVGRLLRFEYNPWRVYQTSSLGIDSALAYLIFPVMLGGLLVAGRQMRGDVRDGDPDRGSFLCLLWMAICAVLLYYPRMDAAHYVSAAVLLYAVGAALVHIGARRIGDLASSPAWRWAYVSLVVLTIAFAANLKLAPKVYSVVMLRKAGEAGFPLIETPRETYAFERLNVYFPIYEKSHRLFHGAFRDMIDYVKSNTKPDEPVFAFPAYPMLYFAAGRDNPTRHDYFLANNVPFDEQVRMLETLEASRVGLLVVPSDENDYFVDLGRPYHDLLWAYIRQEFYLEKRFGPYDVWRRYEKESV